MPLYVVNQIEDLDIDAFALPHYYEIISYYQNTAFKSLNLYEVLLTLKSRSLMIDDTQTSWNDKPKQKKTIELLNKIFPKIRNKSVLKEYEEPEITLEKYEQASFIKLKHAINKLIPLSSVYEKIINYSISKNIYKIAIPVIDFHDNIDKNHYISLAREEVREIINKTEEDITVYLILTDLNNEYSLDYEPEGKIERNKIEGKYVPYCDFKANWERILRYKNTEFSEDAPYDFDYVENNELILKKLGKDLKKQFTKDELGSNRKTNPQNLQEEIQALLDSKEESFSQMVLRIIKNTRRDRIAVYKSANVNKNIFSKIVKDANGDENEDGTPYVYKPDKKIVFAFAIALRLKTKQAEELLRKAGYAFTNYPQDIIVKKFIQKGIYDIDLVNQFLYRFNQPLLGTTSREN